MACFATVAMSTYTCNNKILFAVVGGLRSGRVVFKAKHTAIGNRRLFDACFATCARLSPRSSPSRRGHLQAAAAVASSGIYEHVDFPPLPHLAPSSGVLAV